MKRTFKSAIIMLLVVSLLVPCFAMKFSTTAFAEVYEYAKVVVPETVYMTPSTGESTTGQYYVNNYLDENKVVQKEQSNNNTNGYVYFYLPGMVDLKIAVNKKTDGIGDIVLSGADATTGTYEGTSWASSISNGLFQHKALGLYISGTGINPGNTAVAEWVFTATMGDGSERVYYAYSTLYAPYITPVGAAVKAEANATNWFSNTTVFSQTLSWISGIHGVNESTNTDRRRRGNFTLSSSDKRGALGFLGTDNSAYIGNTRIQGVQGLQGDMYAVFASTTAANSYFWAGQSGSVIDDYAVDDWLEKDTTFSEYSFEYYERSQNPGSDFLAVLLNPTASGKITIDTSRYNNLNQIPNLGVGLLVTDNERGNIASWYVADFSDPDSYNYGKTTNYWQANSADATRYYYDFTTILGGQYNSLSTYTDSLSSAYTGAGLKYAGSWNREIKSGDTATYTIKTFFGSRNSNSTHAMSFAFIDLNATQVNKESLRTLVLKASSLNKNDYTTATWATFYNALQTAGSALTNPLNTDLSSASALQTAMNNLESTVTLDANGGSFTSGTTLAINVTVGDVINHTYTVSYLPGYKVPTRAGYEFKGWATSDDAESGSTTVTAGLMPTLHAVWQPNTYDVVFDNLINFNEWNTTAANNATISNVTKSGFTLTSNEGVGEGTSASPFFPVEPGKQYKISIDFVGDAWDVYIFFCDADGNWIDFADGPTNRYSSDGSTGVPAENAVFTAPDKTEVVQAQIRVDANGSNNSVTFSNIRVYEVGTVEDGVSYEDLQTVAYDSVLSDLPVPTKLGYEFIGWFDKDGNQYTSSSTMNVVGTLYLTSKWKKIPIKANDDSVVIDYGLSVKIDVLANDITIDGGEFTGIAAGVKANTELNEKAYTASQFESAAASSLTLTYGTATKDGNQLVYTPSTANMPKEEEFYYEYKANGEFYYAKVTVIPATNIYYEESFIEFVDGDGYTWKTVGTALTDKIQSADIPGALDKAYGFDEAYNDSYTYSLGA
ncbi:MAG: InlB B-repeat-containing protein, partial [Clostridia bacterium]|nr:InlB B-repeat-containing protein [Clostridia bacterium]